MLHGLFGSLDNWHSFSQDFGSYFHVLALDQRNHGRSPHSPEMDYRVMAEDVREFIEERVSADAKPSRAGAVSLLGHSMGGKTAMEFALRYPERVERLIVGDIAPRAYSGGHERLFAALQALELARFTTRQQIEEALAPELPDLALRRFLLKNLAMMRRPAFGGG